MHELQALLGRISLSKDEHQVSLLSEALQYGASAGKPFILDQLSAFLEQQCRNDELFWLDASSNRIVDKKNDSLVVGQRPPPTFFFLTGGVSHGCWWRL